jgi:hypothetical protein
MGAGTEELDPLQEKRSFGGAVNKIGTRKSSAPNETEEQNHRKRGLDRDLPRGSMTLTWRERKIAGRTQAGNRTKHTK